MGASRESANIWKCLVNECCLLHIKKNIKKCIQSPHFWQDSIFTYWNRWIGCRIFGHRKIQDVSDDTSNKEMFCFNCYRHIQYAPWMEIKK